MSEKQSLFQVYCLGSVAIDKRCSTAVIPWIVEELKLELQDMTLVWVTLGPSSIDYVADSGEEMYTHTYDSVLRWTSGHDSVSFAYMTSSGDTTMCHSFQCLDPNEAQVIATLFKEHCSLYDISDNPIKLSGDKLSILIQQNKKKVKSLTTGRHSNVPTGRHGNASYDATFPVQYCGSMLVKLKSISASTVDGIVSCIVATRDRPMAAKKYNKKWKKRRSSNAYSAPQSNTMFRTNSSNDDEYVTGVHSLTDLEHHEEGGTSPLLERPRASSDITKYNQLSQVISSSDDANTTKTFPRKPKLTKTGSLSGLNKKQIQLPQRKTSRSSTHINKLSCEEEEEERAPLIGDRTAPTPAHPIEHSLESSSTEHEEGEDEIDGEDEYEEFDVLPELKQLQVEPEFAALGTEEIIKNVREVLYKLIPSNLILTGSEMEVTYSEEKESTLSSSNVLLSYSIRRVLGCAQGISSCDYVGLVTREKKSSHHLFHLIKASDAKMAANIIKAFKHSFEWCVALSLPHTVCETCPIHLFNSICQTLNDLPLTDSQSRIHELSLSYLTEQEYVSLLKDYHKDPYENEHTQLVRWVALLRKVYHQQQLSHTHGVKKDKKKIGKKGMRLLNLKPVASSYDNLKVAGIEDGRSQEQSGGLHSHSASDIMYTSTHSSTNGHTSPTKSHDTTSSTWSQSREVSPEISRQRSFPTSHTFPITDPPHTNGTTAGGIHVYLGRQRTDSGALPRAVSPLAVDSGHVSPTPGPSPFKRKHQRSMSWRQQIFESVTPSKNDEYAKRKASIKEMMESHNVSHVTQRGSLVDSIEEYESTADRAKRRWQWAINQQLLLIRLEKANQSVIRETLRRHRLNYADPAVDNVVMGRVWLRLLEEDRVSSEDLLAAIKMGVPPKLREKVWQLLVSHYRSCHPGEVPSGNYVSSVDKLQYDKLCEQTTEYEAVITADIDRTYPSHPYFSTQVKHGRTALYNVLRAYAVADPTVGYCQGLSFVAGLILLHSPSEIDGFQILSHFMNLYGFREIYSSDMYDLQIKLYQFSRLVHDSLPTLHSHLEDHDVTPFLYAAPWFLTVFSSQFPIPFVARIMDLVLYEGFPAIFKVGLAILTHYQYEILELQGMEPITDFLKVTIPQRVTESVSEILHTSTQMTALTIKLQTFETEYHVMHELMATFHMKHSSNGSGGDVETMNEMLKKQNKDLIEQLAVCRGAILRLEKLLENCNTRIDEQQKRIEKLEHDKLKKSSSNNKDTQTDDEQNQQQSLPPLISVIENSL